MLYLHTHCLLFDSFLLSFSPEVEFSENVPASHQLNIPHLNKYLQRDFLLSRDIYVQTFTLTYNIQHFFFFLRSATKTKRQINSFSSANSVKPKAKSCSFNSCCNGWLWVHGVCCGCCRIPSVHRRLQSQQRQTCPEERKKERKKEASEKHVWSSQTALLSSLFHCTFLNNTSPHLPTPTDNQGFIFNIS